MRLESAVNQDILETCILPLIDAQGFGVEYVLCRRVISQDMEVLESNFLVIMARDMNNLFGCLNLHLSKPDSIEFPFLCLGFYFF